jgi:membrane protein YqaA with SNARE-associated domain
VAWIRVGVRRPLRAYLAIAAFAAVPNHVFDMAGLASGAVGIRYPLFLAATFTGRLLRFTLFAAAGPWLLAVWTDLWSA